MVVACDFENGIIYRVKSNGEKREVGSNCNGYLVFRLNGRNVFCHRYLYEQFYKIELKQEEYINHKNHKRDDNRIENLEVVNNQQNCQYQQIPKNNTSGFKGVSFHKQTNKWVARIMIDNKKKHLGSFKTPEEASNAWVAKATSLNLQGHNYFIPPHQLELYSVKK